MDYTNYVNGLTDTNSLSYNLLVSGGDDYKSSSGLMIKGDTSKQKGTHLFQDASDNAFLDLRASAADNAISFRIQDNTLGNVYTSLSLKQDDMTDPDRYGASVGGRIKASAFFTEEVDDRTPSNPGVYVGQDSDRVGTFKINPGTGTGGFEFSTYADAGRMKTTNLILNPDGTVQAPYYQQSNNLNDTETYAVASFDADGKLVRDYDKNALFRAVNGRIVMLSKNEADVTFKINEIIDKINGLDIFSTGMGHLLPAPVFTAPMPGLYAVDTPDSATTGEFTAYVVYGNLDAYQLDANMMIKGGALPPPFDISQWVQIGNYQSGDNFDISYYYNGSVLPRLVEQAAKKVVAKRESTKENFSSSISYNGLAPWKGANWKSIISVR